MELLEDLPRAVYHDHVFTYQGKPIKIWVLVAFKSACKNAGIPYGMKVENGVRFHDIRTTVKTNMLRARLSKTVRDTILGHSLQGMDVYYIKLSDNKRGHGQIYGLD